MSFYTDADVRIQPPTNTKPDRVVYQIELKASQFTDTNTNTNSQDNTNTNTQANTNANTQVNTNTNLGRVVYQIELKASQFTAHKYEYEYTG